MIKVLDHGFIREVDRMGNDESVVEAARISYSKKSNSSTKDLIRYLMRHGHTSPFEMCEIKFHIKCPIYVWRQWIRHRTASVNEYSMRYSPAIRDMQSAGVWRKQSEINKQGSSSETYLDNGKLFQEEIDLHNNSLEVYDKRIKNGISREQARKDLPLSTYTEAFWKIDLHNLLHFLKLRLNENSQFEIREYAKAIESVVMHWVPLSYQAFLDYEINSIKLSRLEVECIRNRVIDGMRGRELEEFKEKIYKLDLENLNENY